MTIKSPPKTARIGVFHLKRRKGSAKTGAAIVNAVRKVRGIAEEQRLSGKLVSEIESQGGDVATLCGQYGLKRADLGRLTGFSLRALAEWSAGKLPSQPAQRRLNEVRRLLDALGEIVKPDVIPAWLQQPNTAFDGITPLQAIELGQIDRLWEMVHDLRSGQPE